MASVDVHVLDFHGPFTHIEILLEDTSVTPHRYYSINRWEQPYTHWRHLEDDDSWFALNRASSKYTFSIEADPIDIIEQWTKYWNETSTSASILGNNCGVAAQWFLNRFADIPNPNLSNLSMNLSAFPLFWPSFLPFPVTLPGRIMANTKFYIEARNHPEKAAQYSDLFLYTSLVLALLTFITSIVALAFASTLMSSVAVTATATVGAVGVVTSTYGFFEAYNLLSAKHTHNVAKQSEDCSLIKDSGVECV
ncbi:MAG: hypothetical protein P1U61_07915 [Legionellaceae bacterium]|nr:hypothetical protein [Legionellaceae bacterium]